MPIRNIDVICIVNESSVKQRRNRRQPKLRCKPYNFLRTDTVTKGTQRN